MKHHPPEVREALKKVEAVGNGGFINTTYRQQPEQALETFRADLLLLVKVIRES